MPRPKACADVITSNAIREMIKMSPDLIQLLNKKNLLNPIWSTELYVQAEAKVSLPFKGLDDSSEPSCYSITRSRLDAELWNHLKEKAPDSLTDGQRVLRIEDETNGKVVVLDNNEKTHATSVILCTGPNKSLSLNQPNLDESNRHSAIGLRAYYSGLQSIQKDTCYLFLDKEWMPGGFYIAPLPDGLYNVNMVIRKDKLEKSGLNLKAEMKKAITEHAEVKEIFKTAVIQGDVQGSPLPLATKKRSLGSPDQVIAGDAAGLIDLISANGIPQAMVSGRLAAEHMIRVHHGTSASMSFKEYEKSLYAAIKPDVRLGQWLSPLLSFPWVNQILLQAMSSLSNNAGDGTGLEEVLYSDSPLRTFLAVLNPLKQQN